MRPFPFLYALAPPKLYYQVSLPYKKSTSGLRGSPVVRRSETSLLNNSVKVDIKLAAFLLANFFSDLDNPDCLDFRASRNKNLK